MKALAKFTKFTNITLRILPTFWFSRMKSIPILKTQPSAPARACAISLLAAALLLALPAVHAATLLVTVIDKDGKPTPDAVVIVLPASGMASKAQVKNPPALRAVVNQEKMQFIPALTVVSPGAKVRFMNNDSWDHHVRMSAVGLAPPSSAESVTAESGFALRLEGKTDGKPAKSVEVTLDRPGAVGANLLGCFIHGSMSGHLFVADSPWTVKTGPDGTATIEDLPDGAASLKVWHSAQLVDMKPQTLSLGAAPSKATVQLDVVPRRRRN